MTDDEEKNAGKKPAEEIIAERYKMEGREAAQKVLKKRREEIGDHGKNFHVRVPGRRKAAGLARLSL